jgi:hypothetical protein
MMTLLFSDLKVIKLHYMRKKKKINFMLKKIAKITSLFTKVVSS